MQSHWRLCKLVHIKLNLLCFLGQFSNPSCPLRFYQYSGDRASHYAAPTTLALSLLVTDRPAIVPATVQCALTLNSLAGRLPVSASSRNTRRLGRHEDSTESTCHCQLHTIWSPWNPPPEPQPHLLTTSKKGGEVWQWITVRYLHNLMTDLDVDSQCLKCDFDNNQQLSIS